MVYIVIILWIAMGILSIMYSADFGELAVFFLSLTGFIGVYVWGESTRKSTSKSVLKITKGHKSTREIMTYLVVFIWVVIGVMGIIYHASLAALAAYYGALTPFVGAYILGETYRQSLKKARDVKDLTDEHPEMIIHYKYTPSENYEEGGNEKPGMTF